MNGRPRLGAGSIPGPDRPAPAACIVGQQDICCCGKMTESVGEMQKKKDWGEEYVTENNKRLIKIRYMNTRMDSGTCKI